MSDTIILNSKILSDITGKGEEYWEQYLENINYSNIIAMARKGKILLVMPDPSSEGVRKAKIQGEQYEKELKKEGDM